MAKRMAEDRTVSPQDLLHAQTRHDELLHDNHKQTISRILRSSCLLVLQPYRSDLAQSRMSQCLGVEKANQRHTVPLAVLQ